MPWWSAVAVGILALAVIATGVFAVLAFLRLGRLAATAEGISARLDDVARAGDELERRLARAEERSEDVRRHARRLETSLERLSVLTWALGDAKRGITRLRESYLRK